MDVIVLSDKKQEFNGVTYYLCGQYFQKNGKRLHRAVWEFHNGTIPKGYHVHHKDGNRHRNDIENLELLEARKHESLHGADEARKEKSKENIKKAIEAAKAWHGTEEGKAWHSENAKKTWSERKPIEYICDSCGKKYETLNISYKGNHFCSNKCKSAFRRKSGVDNEVRYCEKCGKEFISNKYSTAKFCSAYCAENKGYWGRGNAI